MEPSASSFYFSRNHTAHLHNRGITFVLQSVLFRIAPTALEVSLVCGILVRCTSDHPRIPPSYVVAGTYRRTISDGTLLPSRSWRWLRIRGSRFAQLQGGKYRLCTRVYISHARINLRIQYRRAVNQADNKAATVSIDSLINYEAVKVCHLPLPPTFWLKPFKPD